MPEKAIIGKEINNNVDGAVHFYKITPGEHEKGALAAHTRGQYWDKFGPHVGTKSPIEVNFIVIGPVIGVKTDSNNSLSLLSDGKYQEDFQSVMDLLNNEFASRLKDGKEQPPYLLSTDEPIVPGFSRLIYVAIPTFVKDKPTGQQVNEFFDSCFVK